MQRNSSGNTAASIGAALGCMLLALAMVVIDIKSTIRRLQALRT